jgi:hypothetical protein
MSFQDKLWELTNRLFVGTAQGTIKWSETAEEESFRAILNTGLVRVERTRAYQQPRNTTAVPTPDLQDVNLTRIAQAVDGFEYSLLVLDDRNKEIGRYVPDRPEHAMTLRNLWELASRSARNADQKIDFLLQEVENRVKAN